MDIEILISKILAKIKKAPEDHEAYEDLFSLCRDIEEDHFELSHNTNKELRRLVSSAIKQKYNVLRFFDLYKRTLLFDAPHFFDSYLLYLEIERKPEERFYQPRRRILKTVVDALQDLVDDKLDELFISMPPRVGKTTILIMFVTWIIGRNSELSNLYSAYSDVITKKFYDGVLEILNDEFTYCYKDIFPKAKIVETNSKDETLNLDRKKRYPSLTARSLYGTLNGACDCNGMLISDDLIGSIEEALNRERMISAWSKVENNLLTRAKETAKILWCGTRWSLLDPIGNRMEIVTNDEKFKNKRVKIIELPALDEKDESQFDYDYGVGFSTEYYHQRRASFERNNDMASWLAQYMQEPIEREGSLFTPEELRYYNGVLPDKQPDRKFMVVDPAFGGGDYVSSPICYQYGEDIYVPGVVYSNEDKRITQPLLGQSVIRYDVQAMQIEANKSTESYKEGVEEWLKDHNTRINLTTKNAPPTTAKETRIFDKAPDIRERFIFLEDGKRDRSYSMFMQNVFSFRMFAKKQHDDAPDSLAMAADFAFKRSEKVEIFKRPF